MVPHDTAAEAIVTLAGETLSLEETSIAGTLVCHVLALRVDAFDEQFMART